MVVTPVRSRLHPSTVARRQTATPVVESGTVGVVALERWRGGASGDGGGMVIVATFVTVREIRC